MTVIITRSNSKLPSSTTSFFKTMFIPAAPVFALAYTKPSKGCLFTLNTFWIKLKYAAEIR